MGKKQRLIMTDHQFALHAISGAQLLLEEYLRPQPQNNERILGKLVRCSNTPIWLWL